MKNITKLKILGIVFTLFVSTSFGLWAQEPNVNFTLKNAKITNTNSEYFYEADIIFTTDIEFKLGAGELYFVYNEQAFGENIYEVHPVFQNLTGALSFSTDANEIAPYHESSYAGINQGTQFLKLFGNDTGNDGFTFNRFYFGWYQDYVNALAGIASYNLNGEDMGYTVTANVEHKLFSFKIKYLPNQQNVDPGIDLSVQFTNKITKGSFNHPFTEFAQDFLNITNDFTDDEPAIVWKGEDNDLSNTNNWSLGVVPGNTQKAWIPSDLSNYPTLSGGDNFNVSKLIIESGASFIPNNNFTSQVELKRELTPSVWHLISSPVDQNIDDFVEASNLETGTGNNVALASYNSNANHWEYYQNGTAVNANFLVGEGYSIRIKGDKARDVSFTGNLGFLASGNLSITAGNDENFLMGNPSTAYLDAALLLESATQLLSYQTLWVWDSNLNGGQGDYTAKLPIDNFKIAPLQGFFVKASEQGSVSIGENFLSHNNEETFFRGESGIIGGTRVTERAEIHVFLREGTINEHITKIYYLEGATRGMDTGMDAPVFDGHIRELDVYTRLLEGETGNDFEIQSLPNDQYESLVVPIGVNARAGQTIKISIESINLPDDYGVYLQDLDKNTVTKLNEVDAFYEITLNEDLTGIGRFYIHTSEGTLSTTESLLQDDITIYKSDSRNLKIKGFKNNEKVKAILYNVVGQEIMRTDFIGKGVNDITLPFIKPGMYLIMLKADKGFLSKKIIID